MNYKGFTIYNNDLNICYVDVYDGEIDIGGKLWIDFIHKDENIKDCGTIVASMEFECVTKKDVDKIVMNLGKYNIPIRR